jgi:hypothetical protein
MLQIHVGLEQCSGTSGRIVPTNTVMQGSVLILRHLGPANGEQVGVCSAFANEC